MRTSVPYVVQGDGRAKQRRVIGDFPAGADAPNKGNVGMDDVYRLSIEKGFELFYHLQPFPGQNRRARRPLDRHPRFAVFDDPQRVLDKQRFDRFNGSGQGDGARCIPLVVAM